MNIRELNSYVRERCGSPSSALLHPEEIDLNLLEEISIRQSQMMAAGKQLRTAVTQITGPFAKTGIFNGTLSTGWLNVVAAARQAGGLLQVVDAAGTFAEGSLAVSWPRTGASGRLTIIQGVKATGILTITQPSNLETLNINGVVWTFVTGTPVVPAYEVQIGANVNATAVNLAAALNAATDPLISVATYKAGEGSQGVGISPSGLTPPSILTITYDTYGTAGNAFALNNSSGGHVVRGAPTLTGGVNGVVEDETLNINGVAFTFKADGPPPPELLPDNTTRLPYYPDAAVTADGVAAVLNEVVNQLIDVATYTATTDADGNGVVLISYDVLGAIGNTFILNNSSAGAVQRSAGTLTGGAGGVVEMETIVINGVTFTFSNFVRGGNYIRFSEDAGYTAQQIVNVLNLSSNPAITVATYSYTAGDPIQRRYEYVRITYDTAGTVGNAFTLADSSAGAIERSAATLIGGVDGGITNGETINVNGATFTFSNAAGAYNIPFGGDYVVNAANIATKLNASADPLISAATYTAIGRGLVTVIYDLPGALGNLFTINSSSLRAVVASGATLTGGAGGLVEGETIDVDGVVWTFTASANVRPPFITFGADAAENAARIASRLNASVDPLLTGATYSADGNRVNIVYRTVGAAGNAFTLNASSAGAVQVSGPTLTGGSEGLAEKVPPDYVRINLNSLNNPGVYDLMEKVNDVDALTLAEEEGRLAILFYGTELSYALSWDPTGDESFEFWYDRDVSSLAQLADGGTQLPKRFDFAVGEAAAVKCFPLIIMRDESKRTFAELQSQILAANLVRWEREWDQFLYQSATAGSVTQKSPYRTAPRRRVRHFPY